MQAGPLTNVALGTFNMWRRNSCTIPRNFDEIFITTFDDNFYERRGGLFGSLTLLSSS
jgi:hypothetical protein